MTVPNNPGAAKLDIIWNITLVCPWDCTFCCTDAVHVTRRGDMVYIREGGLHSVAVASMTTTSAVGTLALLKDRGITPTQFDIALADRQRRGLELDLDHKLAVLNNLLPHEVEIDFAGGDPLSCYENFLVVKHAAKLFGRRNVSVTCTGSGLGRQTVDEVAETIGRFEFTYDEVHAVGAVNRPSGYNNSNLKVAREFTRLGVPAKAQVPLHSGNVDQAAIERIYQELHQADIDEILLMRTFPVGRALPGYETKWMLERDVLQHAIAAFRQLEITHGRPRVRLQCALKHLDASTQGPNPCDLMRESFGINPSGKLLLSAWATDPKGNPLHEAFVVGDIAVSPVDELLATKRAASLLLRLDDNFGHCKIFAFLFASQFSEDALFGATDPLYASAPQIAERTLYQIESAAAKSPTGN